MMSRLLLERCTMKVIIAAILAVFVLAPVLAADEGALDSVHVERLVALGRLWAQAKYFHPYLAYREIDWDSALVQAIPLVLHSRGADDYAAAVRSMLAALQDPLTCVQAPRSAPDTSVIVPVSFAWSQDSILTVSATDYRAATDFEVTEQTFQEIASLVPAASGVVLDLRNLKRTGDLYHGEFSYIFDASGIQRRFSSSPLQLPSYRWVVHSGFKPERGSTSGDYFTSFQTEHSASVQPNDSSRSVPTIFLVNSESYIPSVAWSLQDQGTARIVQIGAEEPNRPGVAATIELCDGLSVSLRTAEMVSAAGGVVFEPDVVLPDSEDAQLAALSELKRVGSTRPATSSGGCRLGMYAVSPYADTSGLPSREFRMLAAFKIWAVFNYFSPYKELMGEDWQAVLKKSLAGFVDAANVEDYRNAVCEMTAYVHDAHTWVSWPGMEMEWAHPMMRCRYVQDRLIVGRVYSDSLRREIKPGDEIKAVDGEDVSTREKRFRPRISASTEQAMKHRLSYMMLVGPDSSVARITVMGADGGVRDVHATRTTAIFEQWDAGEREGEVMRLITPKIGYADLDRLSVSQVDSLFDLVQNTESLILDMRGYPKGTAWVIAPRLNRSKTKRYGALFDKPVASAEEFNDRDIQDIDLSMSFSQAVPETDQDPYTGKVFVLIDGGAISQAEHTCLFFESVADVTFVGSPTMGANGDVTVFLVPGGISVSLTGEGVRHADGRQLQRVGIQPDVYVEPTIEGIRSGRDEVLEKAVALAKEYAPADKVSDFNSKQK